MDDDERPSAELLGTPDESRLRAGKPDDHAAGMKAVGVAMGRALVSQWKGCHALSRGLKLRMIVDRNSKGQNDSGGTGLDLQRSCEGLDPVVHAL